MMAIFANHFRAYKNYINDKKLNEDECIFCDIHDTKLGEKIHGKTFTDMICLGILKPYPKESIAYVQSP